MALPFLTVFQRVTLFHRSLFALTWVAAGALLPFADDRFTPSLSFAKGAWMLVAFLGARVAGMAFNMVIDRRFDALNPRTQNRVIPSGQASPLQVWVMAWMALGLFLLACFQINRFCFLLSPVIALLLWAYSYTKRVTYGCHFVLGAVQFFGPVMAWGAVCGSLAWAPLLLGVALWASMTAADIVYASQDAAFDRSLGLHSLPAKLGVDRALGLTRWLQGVVLVAVSAAGRGVSGGTIPFALAAWAILGLSIYQTQCLPHDYQRRFGQTNTWTGLAVFLATLGTLLWPK